jgi:AraC family ethanolamine operon transcriptional activator
LNKNNKIESFFTNSIFNDIDQYAEVSKQWDLDFIQLEPGKFAAELAIIGSEDFQAFRTSYSRALLQRGASPKNLIVFGVPRHMSINFFWRGKMIGGNNILIFPLNGEIDTESKKGFDIFGFSFTPEFIEQVCSQLDYQNFLQQIRNTEVVTVSEISMNILRNFLENIFRSFPQQMKQLSNPNFIKTIKYEILKMLLYTIEKHSETSKTYSMRLRDKEFNKAKTYMLEHITKPITVQKLVEETCVTERTLEFAFLERFGVTPKAILRSIRLSGVHKELKLTGGGGTMVSDIATRWGFWHMGQFAKDYKLMFGELPSKTLSQN